MAQGFSLKDQLFNVDTVTMLATHFENAGVFKAKPFIKEVMKQLPPLELKARINMIAVVLAQHLPEHFPDAADAISRSLPPQLDPDLTDDDFGHFIYAPLGVFVENKGLTDHHSLSLDLIKELTKRFSMEFSIRSFFNTWPNETLARVTLWANDDNYHVRRLASEGTRPKLPWGQNIGLTHKQAIPVLNELHSDPTRYVTRSVANHLNDITKIDPDLAIDTLETWRDAAKQDKIERDWIERHALRGLVKSGHPRALRFLGYDPEIALNNVSLSISPDNITIGEKAEVLISLIPPIGGDMIIDYAIDFLRAKGKHSRKVFKCKMLHTKANEKIEIKKNHLFKKGATTFTHYAGDQTLHLQINGKIVASTAFVLS